MNRLRLCNRSCAVATHLASFSRAWTYSSETGATCRALLCGGKRRPQRRTTSSSDQPRATSRSSRTSRCEMIVQDRKPRHGHREDFSKFLEPMFDPAFAVVHPFPEQEGPLHAARNTVIPAGHGRIDQMVRAIVMGGSPGMIRTIFRIQPAESMLLCMSPNSCWPRSTRSGRRRQVFTSNHALSGCRRYGADFDRKDGIIESGKQRARSVERKRESRP